MLTSSCLDSNCNKVTLLPLQVAAPILIITKPPQPQSADALQLLLII